MKIETYAKRIEPRPHDELMVKLGGKEYEVKFVIDLLDELAQTSYGFNHVAIHDEKQRSSLEKERIITTSIRGSSYVASEAKLRKLKRTLEKTFDNFYCDEGGGKTK